MVTTYPNKNHLRAHPTISSQLLLLRRCPDVSPPSRQVCRPTWYSWDVS